MKMMITKKKLIVIVSSLVFFVSGLAVTSYGLAKTFIEVDDHQIVMGDGVKINVNKGEPIIDDSGIIYEPGGSYRKEFTIENEGDADVWYKVYPTGVEGSLKDCITVSILEKDGNVMCRGSISELNSKNVNVGTLAAGETKTLYVELYFSSDAGNAAQGNTVSFDIKADATQKQNNPDKDFTG